MVDYVKIPELARRLDVSEKTARKYVKTGVLPSSFLGGAYRVTEQDLQHYIENARVEPGKALAPLSPQPPLLFSGSETEEERRAIEALDAHLAKLEGDLDRGELDREMAAVHLYIVQVVGPTIPALMQNVAVETAMRPIAERFLSLGRRVLGEARRLGVGDEGAAEAVVFDIERYRQAV
jgi:excisionase family DNA binding protein